MVITAWRQLLTSTPSKKNTPVSTAGANNVAPKASISAVPHRTSSTGHGPKSKSTSSGRASAMNQMSQKVTMKGAARNGNVSNLDIATAVPTATTAASTINPHPQRNAGLVEVAHRQAHQAGVEAEQPEIQQRAVGLEQPRQQRWR